jgi:hypothetical protein
MQLHPQQPFNPASTPQQLSPQWREADAQDCIRYLLYYHVLTPSTPLLFLYRYGADHQFQLLLHFATAEAKQEVESRWMQLPAAYATGQANSAA